MHTKSNLLLKTLKQNLTVLPMTSHQNLWKWLVALCRNGCATSSANAWLLVNFLIYINDIAKAFFFHTALFADDINLHMSHSCFNVLQTTVNLELCKIDHWLRVNKLSLNNNKTDLMLLNSHKHNPTSFKVVINSNSISPEDNLLVEF